MASNQVAWLHAILGNRRLGDKIQVQSEKTHREQRLCEMGIMKHKIKPWIKDMMNDWMEELHGSANYSDSH